MTNEGELTSQLVARGFAAVSAAEYTEQEKAFILSKARMVVLPVGAGMTNLIWAPHGSRVVFLCAPSLTSFMGQSFCDWPRDSFVKEILGHLEMRSVVLRHATPAAAGSLNQGWALRDVAATVRLTAARVRLLWIDWGCVAGRDD